MIKKANTFFSDQERKLIESAISKAESKTSGEIVPVVATQSGRYDRAEDLFGFFFALVITSLAWYFYQDVVPVEGDWALGSVLKINLPILLGTLLAGFLLGIIGATWLPFLRLPFIAKQEMKEEVEKAAAEAFQKFRLRRTRNATGVLIYISLYERMVRILGDDAINEKLEDKDWDDICQTVIQGIRDGRAADGLREAIQKCGILLSEHFPIQPGDQNELSNELKIID